MSSPDAHRTAFKVRCACGIEYHTSDEHIGRALPCRCGRTVVVARPADPPPAAKKTRTVRRKRRFHASDGETQRAVDLNSGFGRKQQNFVSWFLHPLLFGNLVQRTTFITATLYLVAMFAAWMLLFFGSERVVAGTIIAYGPRWLSLWPLALLVPAALVLARSALLPLALAAWIGIVPIMGARISLPTLFAGDLPAKPAAGNFRVVTFNAQGGRGLVFDFPLMLRDVAPDIVLLQECGERLWKKLQEQKDWYSTHYGSLCTASRWPISRTEEMPRDEILRMPGEGGSGLVVRNYIDTPNGTVVAINLHLETARRGLEGMLSREGLVPNAPFDRAPAGPEDEEVSTGENVKRFTANVAIREKESALASEFAAAIAQHFPVVIGGDFNLPVESNIFRRHWSEFTDAFESRGNGLGWTKIEGRWLRIRIDHLLTTKDGFQPQRVIVGPDYQSDHRPVVADFAWGDVAGSGGKNR